MTQENRKILQYSGSQNQFSRPGLVSCHFLFELPHPREAPLVLKFKWLFAYRYDRVDEMEVIPFWGTGFFLGFTTILAAF